MVGLTQDRFQEGQSPRSEPQVESAEPRWLFPVDDREIGGGLDRDTLNLGSDTVRRAVLDGRGPVVVRSRDG